jgi:sugar lactone lactonase YvrE
VYIADPENGLVRRVDITGTVTTVAGGGSDPGSGAKASTESQLFRPYGVAIDSVGNLFIADTYNHLVRKVDASGFISTVAGSGTAGSRGDNGAATSAQLNHPHGLALDANGKLYIADKINHKVRVFLPGTADAK